MIEPTASPDAPWWAQLTSRKHGEGPTLSADGLPRLTGERAWVFKGTEEEAILLAEGLPGVSERHGGIVFLGFGNSVGLFDVPGLGRFEVVSGKWTERHFLAMLDEMTEIAVNLPYSSGGDGALPYDRTVATQQEPSYHAFVYLRSLLMEPTQGERSLLPSLRLILRQPHRKLERSSREVPIERLSRFSASTADHMVRSRELSPVSASMALRIPLAQAMHGFLPATSVEAVAIHSVDNPENRFVLAFLGLAEGIIEGARRLATRSADALGASILADCTTMSQALQPIVSHGLWKEVGPMIHVPVSSSVLQRGRGYRDIFREWGRLRLASRFPLNPSARTDLLKLKDIATLYELWCFAVMARTLEEILGPPTRAIRAQTDDRDVNLSQNAEVQWAMGVSLAYNRYYGASRSSRHSSYSLGLRPDISLEIRTGEVTVLHLFDAKFKVDALASVLGEPSEVDGGGADAAEREGKFKHQDIYKMHTYLDAIGTAQSSFMVYPGTRFRFFSPDGGSDLPDNLGPGSHGVGAVPCLPGDGSPELRALLEQLLKKLRPAAGTSSTDDQPSLPVPPRAPSPGEQEQHAAHSESRL